MCFINFRMANGLVNVRMGGKEMIVASDLKDIVMMEKMMTKVSKTFYKVL